MHEIKVIDNFLAEDEFKKLKSEMLDPWFPWYYNDHTTYDGLGTTNLYDLQFIHFFYRHHAPQDRFEIVNPILQKISPAAIIRIKANLNPVTHTRIIYEKHVDLSYLKCKTAVFYVNTNDGITVLGDDNIEVASIANRLVVFNSDIWHTGTSCTDSKVRCVINFNYVEETPR
jgi:hypothetical protein